MSPAKLLDSALLPVREPAVLIPLLIFSALLTVAAYAGLIGWFLALTVLVPVFRFQVFVLEACAKNETPGALDAEFFALSGSLWTLFPALVALSFVVAAHFVASAAGVIGTVVTMALFVVYMPACLALLVISHSPLESMNPAAVARLYRQSSPEFLIAPLYLAGIGIVVWLMGDAPSLLANFVQLFFFYSFAAVIGALLARDRLLDDVSIPEPLPVSPEQVGEETVREREKVLSHAYGFISRNNRDGGFRHIFAAIERDPDPVAAWYWFFERMLGWEDQMHALFFAQHGIRDLLAHGDNTTALKLIMRCRLINEDFRPFREDIPAAIQAAEASGNIELTAVLKRA